MSGATTSYSFVLASGTPAAVTSGVWTPGIGNLYGGQYTTPQDSHNGNPALFIVADSFGGDPIVFSTPNRSLPVEVNVPFGIDIVDTEFARAIIAQPSADEVASDALYGQRTIGYNVLFNGATFDRQRGGSAANLSATTQSQTLMVTEPGDWSITHTPAAATKATITKAAGAAGVRHICTSISATLIGLTGDVQANIVVNVRDGATGAGSALWSTILTVIPAGQTGVALTGLHIIGSAATAMTIEFATAGAGTTQQAVAMTGHDVI